MQANEEMTPRERAAFAAAMAKTESRFESFRCSIEDLGERLNKVFAREGVVNGQFVMQPQRCSTGEYDCLLALRVVPGSHGKSVVRPGLVVAERV